MAASERTLWSYYVVERSVERLTSRELNRRHSCEMRRRSIHSDHKKQYINIYQQENNRESIDYSLINGVIKPCLPKDLSLWVITEAINRQAAVSPCG